MPSIDRMVRACLPDVQPGTPWQPPRPAAAARPPACLVHDTISNRPPHPTGAQLRELVSISSGAAQQAVMQARQGNARWNPAHATSRLPEGWAEFIAFHCACLAALQEGKRVEAYEKAVAALQPFLKVRRRWGLG